MHTIKKPLVNSILFSWQSETNSSLYLDKGPFFNYVDKVVLEMSAVYRFFLIQLNKYETAPYSIQFSQNLTCDCLLISVFCPEFPQIYLS